VRRVQLIPSRNGSRCVLRGFFLARLHRHASDPLGARNAARASLLFEYDVHYRGAALIVCVIMIMIISRAN